MTNEELLRSYYGGDDSALEKLYHKNTGLIRSIAREAAADYNCLITDNNNPKKLSRYTEMILDDLCGEGAVALLTQIQSRDYDAERASFSTYLYPHIKGRMMRWLEQNIGAVSMSKDEMAAVRQAQRLYHTESKSVEEIAAEMGVSVTQASRDIGYNTHFLGIDDLTPADDGDNSPEWLIPDRQTASAEQIVYRKVCIELLHELFNALPTRDRDILGKSFGIFGFPKTLAKEIGMYHFMKASAVEKARDRAMEKLRAAYPGSRLQTWKDIHRMMRRPVLPRRDEP